MSLYSDLQLGNFPISYDKVKLCMYDILEPHLCIYRNYYYPRELLGSKNTF